MSVMTPHTVFIEGLELQTFPTWHAAVRTLIATGYAHWDGRWLVRHPGVKLRDEFEMGARGLEDLLGPL